MDRMDLQIGFKWRNSKYDVVENNRLISDVAKHHVHEDCRRTT